MTETFYIVTRVEVENPSALYAAALQVVKYESTTSASGSEIEEEPLNPDEATTVELIVTPENPNIPECLAILMNGKAKVSGVYCYERLRDSRARWVERCSMIHETQIRAIAFREGDVWVIQGLEFDIAAHADDPARAPLAFMRAVVENACIAKSLGRDFLAGIKPAPRHFFEMFEKARTTLEAVDPEQMPDPGFPVHPQIRLMANA